ncbi:MAG TPA: hypothetical protein PKN75_13720 [Bacteroidia bacterium]|nr:hypothetical protein [Bacteroidia bacterium]HNU34640.1 hypothetical protein [Bacteroidia bacterium]
MIKLNVLTQNSKVLSGKLNGYIFLLSLLHCLFFVSQNTLAQSVTASATLDTSVILIGQQTKLHLVVTHPKSVQVQFPFVPDTLSKVEFISKSKIDTISSDANNITRKQDITLTAWDSGFYVITPFIFTYKNAGDTTSLTAETQPLLLTTNVIPVDTTKAIRDITKPIAVGLSWQEMLPYIIAALAVLLIIGIIYYLKKRKVAVPEIITPKIPLKPAHIIAIAELDALKEEKLWQQGYFKQYHTRITEIIRAYLGRRYNVDALEMTTDDILNHSQINHLNNTNFEQVKYLLQLADLAKFAKAQPLALENEQALSSAYLFVDATKEQTVKHAEKKEESNV